MEVRTNRPYPKTEKIQMVTHMCDWKTEEKRMESKKYFKNFPERMTDTKAQIMQVHTKALSLSAALKGNGTETVRES